MVISFIRYLNSLKQFVPWRTASKVCYTSNTLSVSLQKSVQSGHWYRKFRNSKQRNSTRKSYFKIPLLMKDQSCTRDCSKQTNIRALMENISLISRKKNCYSPAQVGPYWEKLCNLSQLPVLKTLGTVLPNTDLPAGE